MGQDPGTGSAAVTQTDDVEQIQHEIKETRERLGDTVEALAQKADLKAQAKHKLGETKASVAEKKEQLLGKAREASPGGAASVASQASQKARNNPVPVAVAGAFAAGFVAGRAFGR
jgi:ElaB/YqjD/DUF883 family membrane-anchored ribosome-binding protein